MVLGIFSTIGNTILQLFKSLFDNPLFMLFVGATVFSGGMLISEMTTLSLELNLMGIAFTPQIMGLFMMIGGVLKW